MIRRTDEGPDDDYTVDDRDSQLDHWASAPDHHRLAAHRKLVVAHQGAVNGPPNPRHFQRSGPMKTVDDPTLVNQFYRNSVGSPHHAGVGARADNEAVELLAPGWHANRRPRESFTPRTISPDELAEVLGRRPSPTTSTRIRPSDEDYS